MRKKWGFGVRQNANGTVSLLSNGLRIHNALALPFGWCYENVDGMAAASLSLPPIDSAVFCLLAEDCTAFVLCGWPLLNKENYKELQKEQDNESESKRRSLWKRILHRPSGKWTLLQDQEAAKCKIEVDPEEETITATDFQENQYRSDRGQQELLAQGDLHVAVEGDCNIESQSKIVIEASAIELGGNAKDLVTHAELESAITAVIAAIKTHTHLVATSGSPSAQSGTAAPSLDISSLSINMDAAKAQKIKVG